jgi:hypothetical protein
MKWGEDHRYLKNSRGGNRKDYGGSNMNGMGEQYRRYIQYISIYISF